MKKSFRLAETTIITTAVALLTFLAFPGFLTALNQAENDGDGILCVNNLRQIGMAIANYCADHDGHYPHVPMCDRLTDPPSTFAWWSVLAEKGYLPGKKKIEAMEEEQYAYLSPVFICRSQFTEDDHPNHGPLTANRPATCYGLNIFFDSWIVGDANARKQTAYWARINRGYSQDNPNTFVDGMYPSLEGDIKTAAVILRDGSTVHLPVRENTLQQPGEKFLVADVRWLRPGTYYRNKTGSLWHNVYWNYTPFFGHTEERCNVLFADYHVGSINSDDEGVLNCNSAKDGISSSRVDESTGSPSVPGALSTNARFYHWSPFAVRQDWQNWPPEN